ncbi:MAG: hypothetical protein JWO12_1502 [Frankiales bacterium]|nr:hypothetical protein [Frankiales bacterium]
MNVALAAFFLAFLIPLVLHFESLARVAQVMLSVLVVFPFGLLTLLCLTSAARPGSLGRFARKHRPVRKPR